jgi:hypothetical protein
MTDTIKSDEERSSSGNTDDKNRLEGFVAATMEPEGERLPPHWGVLPWALFKGIYI